MELLETRKKQKVYKLTATDLHQFLAEVGALAPNERVVRIAIHHSSSEVSYTVEED